VGVEPTCAVLSGHGVPIAASTYYGRATRGPSRRDQRDEQIAALIGAEREQSQFIRVVASRKMWLRLRGQGHEVARCTVERVMRSHGWQGAPRGPPLGLGVGGHGDHPRRGALLQSVEEQGGEQERRQMVEGEGALQPVGGDVAGVPVPPTWLTSTSVRGRRWRASPASRRTSNWADRPAANTSTGPPPAALSSPVASLVRAGSRPQIARSAPILARPRAAALPIPPLAPVTSTVLPAIGPLWSCPVVGLRGNARRPAPQTVMTILPRVLPASSARMAWGTSPSG